MLCSGKVTWDLVTERANLGDERTAIARVEQLYPLPAAEIQAEMRRYPNLRELRWVQDEPGNQGPWPFIALHLPEHLGGVPLYRISRPESASPSVGSHSRHVAEQRTLLEQSFA